MLRKIKQLERQPQQQNIRDYSAFGQLDGSHPWQDAVPEGSVLYPARVIEQGTITYFNFNLAKEMGLIPQGHPSRLNPALEKSIIETFNLRIINEFDQERPRLPANWKLKPKKFMATRYLQLQHANKRGTTSGDGRSIWNGVITSGKTTWDVSSRGTGVTRLAPGFVQANKPLQTGCTDFGYGCGLAELDELYSTAVQSEIFHLQGISTERVLCIIDQGDGCGIGVRAQENLLRPAHLFLYLKQSRLPELKAGTDYFIRRQLANRRYGIHANDPRRYSKLARTLATQYGKFAGRLEAEYVFVWLDWDGDNVLLEPGIIDYGSVRQFGLCHNRYRYDDVERFSTTLTEQKVKAFQIAQTLVQMCHYLETGRRLPVQKFANHPILKDFAKAYHDEKYSVKLAAAGFNREQCAKLLAYPRLLKEWEKQIIWLEERRKKGGPRKLPDGITVPALFDVKSLLRNLPELLAQAKSASAISYQHCLKLMNTKYVTAKDLPDTKEATARIVRLAKCHQRLLKLATPAGRNWRATARTLAARARKKSGRIAMTGDALIHCTTQIIESHRRSPKDGRIQNLIDLLVSQQTGARTSGPMLVKDAEAWSEILGIIERYRHNI